MNEVDAFPGEGTIRKPFFTVFTATFNRADTLPRTYASICRQTERDFEWVIVDDGSDDGTGAMVEEWRRTSPFPIRYAWQPNRGKHTAVNLGARLAAGTLFASIDSDDELLPDSLALIRREWEAIPPAERERYCGVSTLCVDEKGQLIGTRFPTSPLDCSGFEARHRYGARGEKFTVHRVDVMREHRYPEPEGIRNIPPGYVWMDMDKSYIRRHVNLVCRIYWADWGGGRQITGSRDFSRYAPGHAMWHAKILNDLLPKFRTAPRLFIMSAIRYSRFSFHNGHGLIRQAAALSGAPAKALWMLTLPFGIALLALDHIRAIAARLVVLR